MESCNFTKKEAIVGFLLWIYRNFPEQASYRTPPGDCFWMLNFQIIFSIPSYYLQHFSKMIPLKIRLNYESKHRRPSKLKYSQIVNVITYLMLTGSRWLLITSLLYFLESTENYTNSIKQLVTNYLNFSIFVFRIVGEKVFWFASFTFSHLQPGNLFHSFFHTVFFDNKR